MCKDIDLSLISSVMSAASDSIYAKKYHKGSRGKFVYVNEHMAKNSGLTPEEMIGKTDFSLRPRLEADKILQADLQVMKTKTPILDRAEKLTRPNGEEVWVSASKFPWYQDGVLMGVVGVSRNITTRKAVEEELFTMTAMSMHDVINGLNNVALNLQMVTRGIFGEVESQSIQNALNDILHLTNSTAVMARDYLTKVSVMDRVVPIRKELYDLRNDIINPVLAELSQEIKSNNIIIDNTFGLIPDGKITVLADRLYLKTVYRNLIKNAIKYGGKNTIISFGYEDLENKWRLNVYNNGPAIPEEFLPYLFVKFKSHFKQNQQGGIGLALYSIKKMIESHGGTIEYRKTLSDNPNFIFELPKK